MITFRPIALALVTFSLLCPTTLWAQPAESTAPTDELAELREELQQLRIQVAQLKLAVEQLGGSVRDAQPPSIPATAAAAAPGDGWPPEQIGQLEAVDRVEPEMDQDQQQRMAQLQQEADQAEQQVAQAKAAMGDATRTVGIGGIGVSEDADDRDRQIRAQRRAATAERQGQLSEVAAAEEFLQSRQQDLQAYREQYGPHYLITLTRDGTTVTLRVDPETFEAASFDPALPSVRWQGQLLEMDGQQQRWRADRIASVAAAAAE